MFSWFKKKKMKVVDTYILRPIVDSGLTVRFSITGTVIGIDKQYLLNSIKHTYKSLIGIDDLIAQVCDEVINDVVRKTSMSLSVEEVRYTLLLQGDSIDELSASLTSLITALENAVATANRNLEALDARLSAKRKLSDEFDSIKDFILTDLNNDFDIVKEGKRV